MPSPSTLTPGRVPSTPFGDRGDSGALRGQDGANDAAKNDATPWVAVPRPADWWAVRLPWWLRVISVGAGTAMLTLLITAFLLTPAQKGFETHTQLGLSKCFLVQVAGIRCPSCGMTTSWSYLTKGNLLGALSANTGGTLLGFVVMVSAPYLLIAGLVGRWPYRQPNEIYVAITALAVLVVTMTDWTVRLTGGF